MATVQEPQNDDPVIADIFRRGLEKIAGVDQQEVQETSRIKEDAKTRKVDIVKEIAAELEKEYEAKQLPITAIPQELVAGLQGKVSQTVIYEALGDKYKDQRQANRRKGKGKKPVSEAEPTTDENKQPIEVLAGGSSHTEAGAGAGALPNLPLGSSHPERNLTIDAFLPTVDEVIEKAEKVDGGYFIREDVFQKLVMTRPRVAA